VGVAACQLKKADSHCGTVKAKEEESKTVVTTLKNSGHPNTFFNALLRMEKKKKKRWRRKTRDGLQKCGNNSIHCRNIRMHLKGGEVKRHKNSVCLKRYLEEETQTCQTKW
jgi:N-acetylneuraminic acid mutarotase